MRLKEKSKKNLGLCSLNRRGLCLVTTLFISMLASLSHAEPIVGGIPLPPASFTYVDSPPALRILGMQGSEGAWCYDIEANAVLITAPARAKSQCELTTRYEIEKLKLMHEYEVGKLELRIETLTKQHAEISLIRDKEVAALTDAALKRPNDYSVWWATGGFTVGIVSTILISMAVSN